MKRYKKESYKTKDEWLKHRGIGGSDVATILGYSKWQTIDDLYSRLALKKFKKEKQNDRMQEGTKAEPLIRSLYVIEHSECKVISPPKSSYWLFRSLDNSLITCSPDGFIKDKNNVLYGLEIKDIELIRTEDKEIWGSNELPQQYFLQLLQYLIVFNDMQGVCLHARLKYYVWKDGEYLYDYCVERDYWAFRNEVIKEIEYVKRKEIDFIENNVLKKKRPKLIIKI